MKAIAENLIKVSIREKDEGDLADKISPQPLDKELIIPYNLGN